MVSIISNIAVVNSVCRKKTEMILSILNIISNLYSGVIYFVTVNRCFVFKKYRFLFICRKMFLYLPFVITFNNISITMTVHYNNITMVGMGRMFVTTCGKGMSLRG